MGNFEDWQCDSCHEWNESIAKWKLDYKVVSERLEKANKRIAAAIDQVNELKLRVECAAGSIELMQEYAPEVRCDLLAQTFRDAINRMPDLK